MTQNYSNPNNDIEISDESVLYISDLNGTLLNSNNTLTPFTVQTINDCIKNGMLFSVATGRAYENIMPLIKQLKLNIPIILHNGVVIYSPKKSRYILKYFLSPTLVHEIIDFLQNTELNPIIYKFGTPGNSKVYFTKIENPSEKNFLGDRISRKNPRFVQVEKFPLNLENLIQITVIEKFEKLNTIKEIIEQKFDVSTHFLKDTNVPGYYWLEICHSQGTKRNAVQFLKRYLKAKKIVCFGDSHNDLSMFEIADECYAVSNAIDELKSVANDVLLSNDENGVANFLKTR